MNPVESYLRSAPYAEKSYSCVKSPMFLTPKITTRAKPKNLIFDGDVRLESPGIDARG